MKIRNWLINGLALCAMSVPSVALEVYNNDDKKVEVYGNIRGYLMESNARNFTSVANNVTSSTTTPIWNNGWNAGLQTNSRLGAKFTLGKFLGHIELGAQEPGLFGATSDLGLRLIYGQYNFGKMGKVTFGKTNTPTVVTGFVNDVMATDNGAWGFGALPISVRKFQLQYSIAGITLALIEDSANLFGGTPSMSIPRIAIAYDLKLDSMQIKVGGSFRQYQNGEAGNKYPAGQRYGNGGTAAFHLLAALKANISKMYVSGILHYGMNGDLYGEQRSTNYVGGYNHAAAPTINLIFNNNTQLSIGPTTQNVHRFGFHIEGGIPLSSIVSVIVGAGYQATLFYNDSSFHSYKLSVAAPIKVNEYITLTPQLGWYDTIATGYIGTGTNAITANISTGGFAGIVRAEFNF